MCIEDRRSPVWPGRYWIASRKHPWVPVAILAIGDAVLRPRVTLRSTRGYILPIPAGFKASAADPLEPRRGDSSKAPGEAQRNPGSEGERRATQGQGCRAAGMSAASSCQCSTLNAMRTQIRTLSERLGRAVDRQRLLDTAFRLVGVPSRTGEA